MLRRLIIVLFAIIFVLIPFISIGQNNQLGLNTLIIDAGHGGKDPGTSVGTLKEKDIALEVSLRLSKLIQKQHPEVNVILTREKDVFVPLDKRADIANKAKADLFISIHVNYFQSSSTYGSETYILGNHRSEENLQVAQLENSVILLEDDYTTTYEGFDPNSAESYIMFELIQNEFQEQSRFFADNIQSHFISVANRRSRGVRQAGFLVLRKTAMPSILIELGFISNANDKQFLQTDNGKQLMANSIADAFTLYKERINSRSNIKIANTIEKKEDITEKKTTRQILSLQEIIKDGNWHAIQILASKTEVDINNKNFAPFSSIYTFKENGWNKYYIGLSKNYGETRKLFNELKAQKIEVFPVTFIHGEKQAFKNF